MGKKDANRYPARKKVQDKEVFIFLVIFPEFFACLGGRMGVANML